MHNLAVLIVGSGKDDADYAAAANWFQQAAERGLTDSQFNLAMLHAHGRGVAKDLAEAYKWFALAARGGDSGAARKLEEIKAQLDPSEREAGEQKLAAWRPKAAEPASRPAASGAARDGCRIGALRVNPCGQAASVLAFPRHMVSLSTKGKFAAAGRQPGRGRAAAAQPRVPCLAGAGLATDAFPRGPIST